MPIYPRFRLHQTEETDRERERQPSQSLIDLVCLSLDEKFNVACFALFRNDDQCICAIVLTGGNL